MPNRDIIVVGASAGGVQVVLKMAGGLSKSLPASVFVIIHTSPSSPGILPRLIDQAGPLPAAFAHHGEPIRRGRIYVARPDQHMLLVNGSIHLSRGPKENGFRPAVDPLFRTAAEWYGPRVIGVVLSGGLDDGSAGLLEIKRQGGLAIVQDPDTAEHRSMPASAARHVDVDHVVPVRAMGSALTELAGQSVSRGENVMPRKKGAGKPDVAEAADLTHNDDELPDAPSGFVCPECGGALWEVVDGKLVKYRCHVGHGFTANGLLTEQTRALENALWTALRALEENAALRRRMAQRFAGGPVPSIAREYEKNARDAEERAALIREVLLNDRVPPVTRGVRAAAAGARSKLSKKKAGGAPLKRRKA